MLLFGYDLLTEFTVLGIFVAQIFYIRLPLLLFLAYSTLNILQDHNMGLQLTVGSVVNRLGSGLFDLGVVQVVIVGLLLN